MSKTFVQLAEEYIRDSLIDLDALEEIGIYILGDLPRPWPQHWFPAAQIIIVPEVDTTLTTTTHESTYEGQIAIWIEQQTLQNQDYTAETDAANKTVTVTSYNRINAFVQAIRDELERDIHNDMQDLRSDDGEFVCGFFVIDRLRGAAQGERQNTWQNVGRLQFRIITQRLRSL